MQIRSSGKPSGLLAPGNACVLSGLVTTRVRMHWEVGGERLPVNQLGPDFAFVEATSAHLPGQARLFVTVDDDLTIRPVFLPEGIQPGAGRTRIALG